MNTMEQKSHRAAGIKLMKKRPQRFTQDTAGASIAGFASSRRPHLQESDRPPVSAISTGIFSAEVHSGARFRIVEKHPRSS